MDTTNDNPRRLLLVAPEQLGFMRPYLERALAGSWALTDEPRDAEAALVIAAPEAAAPEAMHSLPTATLRCAHIVGTGMTGLPRRILESVASGRFVHSHLTDALTVSVVHALDVAHASAILAGKDADVELCAADVALPALVDALAWRVGERRVFRGIKMWGWLAAPRGIIRQVNAAPHFSPDELAALLPEPPIDVINYLRTHDYSQDPE